MTLKQKISKGVLWTTIERFSTQIIQFSLSILIARIISPSDFGVMAILMVFINLSQVFVDSGFGKSLIQKNNPTKKDSSTVFFFNLIISIAFFGILWLSAPGIARFYNNFELIILLRVISFVIVINAITIVHQALLSIQLDFKSLAIANFISTIFGGILGLVLALNGLSIWALVGQAISRSVVFALIIVFRFRWLPSSFFSLQSFKQLYRFGVNIFATSLISSIVSQSSLIILGRLFQPAQLGFYSKGIQISTLPYYTIYSIVNRVLFPALSSVKGDKLRIINMAKEVLKYVAFISAPVFLYLGMNATSIVDFLLTEKWLPAVPIIQIFCVSRLISIVASISIDLLNSIGRSDLILKQELLKTFVRLSLMILAIKFGIIWLAVADMVATIIAFFINTYYPGKILNFGSFEQLKNIFPILISGVIASLVGFFTAELIDESVFKILVSLVVTMVTYIPLLFLFGQSLLIKSFRPFLEMIVKR